MKKLLTVLIIVCISSSLSSTDKKWTELTDEEQWKLYQEALTVADEYKEQYEKQKEISNDLRVALVDSTEKLKKSFSPFFSLSIGAGISLDSESNIDITVLSDFQFFILSRIYIEPGLSVKLYDKIGAGISVKIGVLF